MSVLTVLSPGLKVLFNRIGRPEIINRPSVLRLGSPLAKWVLQHGGSIAIDRADPSPSSIKTAVDVLQGGEIILIFPSGTRKGENIAFKRGAAAIALRARVPLVPAFYEGPKHMQIGHIMHRPRIRVTFGTPIQTTALPHEKATTLALTRQLEVAIGKLQSTVNLDLSAA